MTMIIWINGAFGSGKTQTANELCRRLPDAFLYDPENVGDWLRKNEPARLAKENFQDEPLWRTINRDMLSYLDRQYAGTLVVPMTLIRRGYYDEIIGALRGQGVTVHHVLLCATEATLRRRLRKRLEPGKSWAARQIPACLAAFESDRFENKIQTDEKTVPEVAESIAKALGLSLSPGTIHTRSGPDKDPDTGDQKGSLPQNTK